MKQHHDFRGDATVNEFRDTVRGEWLDNLKGVKIYVRKPGVGCWKVDGISKEDSGIYVEAGEESNPQHKVESHIDDAQILESF